MKFQQKSSNSVYWVVICYERSKSSKNRKTCDFQLVEETKEQCRNSNYRHYVTKSWSNFSHNPVSQVNTWLVVWRKKKRLNTIHWKKQHGFSERKSGSNSEFFEEVKTYVDKKELTSIIYCFFQHGFWKLGRDIMATLHTVRSLGNSNHFCYLTLCITLKTVVSEVKKVVVNTSMQLKSKLTSKLSRDLKIVEE